MNEPYRLCKLMDSFNCWDYFVFDPLLYFPIELIYKVTMIHVRHYFVLLVTCKLFASLAYMLTCS